MTGSCSSSCTCGQGPEQTGAKAGVDAGRRAFLASGAAFATTTLTPGFTLMAFGDEALAKAPDAKVSAKQRWGLLIDAARCKPGCNACVTACQTENGWKDTGHPATDAQWIRTVTVRNPKLGTAINLPVMCQHCANPPCADVCPTGASFKRADGIVLVDKHLCIGCRYCMMACPYKARSFIHEALEDQKPDAPRGKGTVESCTMCVHRVDAGQIPACVESCSATGGGAMMFGDINDPNTPIAKKIAEVATSQIRADLGLDPGVRYRNI